MNAKQKRLIWWGGIITLLLLTFAVRTWRLETVPPGLTHDEASNGHDSAAILQGTHRIYFPVGYGHEPLYNYSVAALTLLLGQSIFTLRFTTVIWSLFTWIFSVALAQRWWGKRAALFTGAALSVGFWPLMMARIGLRGPTLPALLSLSVLAYTHAVTSKLPRRAWIAYIVAGFALGLGFYTYMASRGMLILYLAFLATLIFTDRTLLHRVWKGTLIVTLIALGTAMPLGIHLLTHPELEQRIAQLGGAITALGNGDWQPLWQNITASLPMLLWRADPRWLYNIAGRPALEPFLALTFILGIITAISHYKVWTFPLLLLWLAGGLAPALLTTVEYNTLHAIAAMPAVFLLIGRGAEAAWCALSGERHTQHAKGQHHKKRPRLSISVVICLGLGFLLTGTEATRAYFATWGEHRDVRVSYHHHLVALGQYLEENITAELPVVITSIYPGEFHDPYTMEVTLRSEDLDLRWSNAQSALFFPKNTTTQLFTETLSMPGANLQPLILDHASQVTSLDFRDDDLISSITHYSWDANAAWDNLQGDLQHTIYAAPGDPPPGLLSKATQCPVAFGKTLTLTGYTVTPLTAKTGMPIDLLTAWEVQNPPPTELTIFTHLLEMDGTLITQVDRLDAPSWQWQSGDRFVQVHRLALPPEFKGSTYRLAIGAYSRANGTRLSVLGESDLATDTGMTRVVLGLEVETE